MIKGKTEPRIWTKPLQELTPENTLGYAFCDFCDMIGVDLLPWQKWLAVHALEIVHQGEQWQFRYRYVIIIIARQNGKTFFEVMLNLFFLFGLKSHLILGTAQNLDTAIETFEDTITQIENTPELASMIQKINRGTGKRELVIDSGDRYKVVAATRKARGLSSDLILMDELREQTNWEAWGAISKTMMARPTAILFGFSNAGDVNSVVLRHLRMQGHAMCGDPDGIADNRKSLGGEDIDESLGIFEWSGEPNCALDDREAWAQANPSLGYGFMTERALQSAMITDPEPIFRTECISQWVETLLHSPFPDGGWEAGIDEESFIPGESEIYYGIDMSQDRTWCSISACGMREDGNYHVEVIARRVGTEWAIDWFRDRANRGTFNLAFQGRGAPVCGLAEQICTLPHVNRCAIEGPDLTNGWERFWDGVAAFTPFEDGTMRGGVKIYHLPQPILDMPAKTMQIRNIGNGQSLPDRMKSPDDISPLFACIMAFSAATAIKTDSKKIYASAYSSTYSFASI